MIQLPNNKKCYNLPEQVAQNLLNIQYLAEQYKNIDELPSIWADYKTAFDADLHTFEDWTTTFEGWENTLATYLANMSSAAVGAIAGQNIAPANVAATGNLTANSIIENMAGYSWTDTNITGITKENTYVGCVKTGNKITFVVACQFTVDDNTGLGTELFGYFTIPSSIGEKLYPYSVPGSDKVLDQRLMALFSGLSTSVNSFGRTEKMSNTQINMNINLGNVVNGTKYMARYELTFLLSDNLAA